MGMKQNILSILLLAMVMAGMPINALGNDTPLKAIQAFKQALDANDLATMCQYMSDEEGTGALKRVNYEQMQRSVEGLVSLWRGVPFSYGDEPTVTSKQVEVAVKVDVPSLSQEVKFTLLKFGNAWYIFDMEIYFKKK